MFRGGIGKQVQKSQDIQPGFGGLIEIPEENDVLSGRGGRINNHPGNLVYRMLVNKHKHSYLDKHTKKLDKVKIANHIVMQIRNTNPPGRFLRQDTETKLWKEIGDEKARKKAGQAMREKAPETRRELEEGKVTPQVITTDINVTSPSSVLSSPMGPNSPGQYNSTPPIVVSHQASMHVGSHPEATVGSHAVGGYDGMAAYPRGFPQAGPNPYPPNNLQDGGNGLNYATHGHVSASPHAHLAIPMHVPSNLPDQQLNGIMPHSSQFRPYSEIGKKSQSQSTIHEEPLDQTKTERQEIMGANAAAFNRPFNRTSSSTNQSSISSFGAPPTDRSTPISTTSSANFATAATSSSPSPVSSSTDEGKVKHEDYQRENYRHLIMANSSGNISERELRRKYRNNVLGDVSKVGDGEREPSYLPSQLTNPSLSESSIKMTDVYQHQSTDYKRASAKEMSMDEDLRGLIGNLSADLNSPELNDSLFDWNASSGRNSSGRKSSSSSSEPKSIKRERLKSESDMSFRGERGIENSSCGSMSVDSKVSNSSSWLNSFKSMQGLPPAGDLRDRFLSDYSQRSMLSELSTDMHALDLAADNSNSLFFSDPNSPSPTSPSSPSSPSSPVSP